MNDTTGSTLISVRFAEPLMAQEMLLAFARLVKQGAVEMEDAAMVTKDEDGKIRLRQTRDVMPGQGAASVLPREGSSPSCATWASTTIR